MNKAIMISTHKVYNDKIKLGIKDLEIRPYAISSGTKVYGRETLKDGGNGLIGYEFVVGEVHKLIFNNVLEMVFSDKLSYKDIKERGCVGYNYFTIGKKYYAMEITDLIVYDTPLDISEFVGWNKGTQLKSYPQGKIYVKRWRKIL